MNNNELPELIYGVVDNNVVIAPKQLAIECASTWHAIKNATTWQDYIDYTSRESFDVLILEILTILGYEALYPQYLNGENLANYITDLHLPLPEDNFTTDILPGFDEGEFVPNLQQEILAWLPENLISEFGEMEQDDRFGFRYKIKIETVNLVATTLKALGYRVEENNNLIAQACGFN